MANALDQYIQFGGVRCPRCGGNEIEGDDGVEIDAGIARQDVTCLTCNLEWYDQYILVGIQLSDPELLGPDGEFTKTQDYIKRNDDGSITVFQGCDGDWESCEDHWVNISQKEEDGKQVVYFRAYDNHGRRGNISVPARNLNVWSDVRLVDPHAILEQSDEYGSITIDPLEEMLYISTGPHGQFQMPFGDDAIEALLNLMSESEE